MARYPSATNQSDIVGIFKYANEVSSNIFGVGILISLYVIVFSYLKLRGTETEDSLLVAGYITTITSIFLFLLTLISEWHMAVTIIITVLTFLWAYWSKG